MMKENYSSWPAHLLDIFAPTAELRNIVENNQVCVVFDMDGVLCDYVVELDAAKREGVNFFLNKRPLKSIIHIAEQLCKIKNVEIKVVTLCRKKFQADEKKEWLKIHAPFINQQIIHVLDNETNKYKEQNLRNDIKGITIKNFLQPNTHVFLVEDTHKILTETSKHLPSYTPLHISSLVQ